MSFLPPVREMNPVQLTQYVVDVFRYNIQQMLHQDDIREPFEPQAKMDYQMQSMVFQLEKLLYRTTESTRCEKSTIKKVFTEEIGRFPMGLRDYIFVAIGLKRFARMRVVLHNTTINIENKITVIEKHCPHNNIPKNSPEHLLFLAPPRRDDEQTNFPTDRIHRRND